MQEAARPFVYLKVPVGLDAIYDIKYTQSMIDAVEPVSLINSGYKDGVTEKGTVVSTVVDKIKGLILAAAEYVLDNDVSSPCSLTVSY